MARIWASLEFDHREFDLSMLSSYAYDAVLFDDTNLIWNAKTYQDTLLVNWYMNRSYYYSVFAGYDITINGTQAVTGGVVTGYVEAYHNGSEWAHYLGMEDFSASALDLYNASQTLSIADDYAIISAALAGTDQFELSGFSDYAFGLAGNDTLRGNGGTDTLLGGSGDDALIGGPGNDRLVGGTGKDLLTGASGADHFIFQKASASSGRASTADVISDFVRGTDKISLSAIDAFANGGTANDTFLWRGTSSFSSGIAGEIRYQKYDTYTLVLIDLDGDSNVEMSIRVNGLHSFTSSDFIL